MDVPLWMFIRAGSNKRLVWQVKSIKHQTFYVSCPVNMSDVIEEALDTQELAVLRRGLLAHRIVVSGRLALDG